MQPFAQSSPMGGGARVGGGSGVGVAGAGVEDGVVV